MAIVVSNPPQTSTSTSTATPTYSALDFTVPADTQLLIALPVQIDGYLYLNGDWVEIS